METHKKLNDLTKWINAMPDWLEEMDKESFDTFDKLVAKLIEKITIGEIIK